MDFHQLPEMRKKYSENDKVLRTNSLQPNVTRRVKQPLARHISSPMRFNYTSSIQKPKECDRTSETSFTSAASKMSFRNFLRRMSSKRRKPMTESSPVAVDTHRDKRKSMRTISIRFEIQLRARLTVMMFHIPFIDRSITEAEEVINNSFEERDEHARVASYISKCSEETEDDDDASVSKLIGLESLSLHKCLSNDS